MINIYTVKWGFKYGPEYVNRILQMCREYITQEFKFYCITEHPGDLDPEVIVIPIPEDNYYEKWWNKLYLFDKNVVRQMGEKLFLDLDIGIQHNIDCIVEYDPEDTLTFIRTRWHHMKQMKEDTKEIPFRYTDLNSSVLRWNDKLVLTKALEVSNLIYEKLKSYGKVSTLSDAELVLQKIKSIESIFKSPRWEFNKLGYKDVKSYSKKLDDTQKDKVISSLDELSKLIEKI